MMEFLGWVEQLGLSTWIRESGGWYGYALILFLHTMGLSIVVGASLALDLRLLGWIPVLPLKPMDRVFPVIWGGFALNAASGTLLLMADATTKLTNWVFYVKMGLIAVGIWTVVALRKKVFASAAAEKDSVPESARSLAWISVFCWLAAVTAGRLLAYIGPVAGL